MLRRTFTWLSIGLALGVLATMWLGPRLIQWWWKVPGAQAAFSCDPQIAAATEWLVKLQLAIGATSAFFFAIVANLVARARSKNGAAPNAGSELASPD